jgi:hypothetical protein
VEAVHVNNAILLDYLTSEVALEEPAIASTNPNLPIAHNCTDDELHLVMPGGSWDCEDEGDESNMRDAFHMGRRRRRPATEYERFHLGISHVDGYEGEDGANADADEEEEASESDD